MEYEPPTLCVPKTMPPVEEERSDEPSHKALDDGHLPVRELEERQVTEDLYPQPSCGESYQELRQVNEDRARVPPLRVRQLPPRKNPFKDEEDYGRQDDKRGRKRYGADWERRVRLLRS